MDSRIKTFLPFKDQFVPVDAFGYCTKGIPGLEIVGLGTRSRFIKEKFIYLTRLRKIKLPIKRFVICVEGDFDFKDIPISDYAYLELPLLILFWSLSKEISIYGLENCITAGQIKVSGEIDFFRMNDLILKKKELEMYWDKESKWLIPSHWEKLEGLNWLPIDSVLQGRGLYFS